MNGRRLALIALAVMSWGCAARTWRVARDNNSLYLTPPARKARPEMIPSGRDATWLDLQAGWRLRTITPILKSGGFRVPTVARQQGLTIEVDSKGEFLGLETAYYSVNPDMTIAPVSVEATIDGKSEQRKQPLARLFEFPPGARHVRLIYLIRQSEADHDMAVLAGRNSAEIDQLTRRVQTAPATGCTTPHCAWVPAGIAVVAQARVVVDGSETWVAANSRLSEVIKDQQPAEMLRQWKGKAVPVTGATSDLIALPVAGGDIIQTRKITRR